MARTEEGSWQEIFVSRHSISLNLFLILPLLIVYEVGIRLSGTPLCNAAEFVLKDVYRLLGPQGARFFHWFMALVILVCFFKTTAAKSSFLLIWLAVVLEGLVLAVLLGPLLSWIFSGALLEYPLTSGDVPDLSTSIMLSIGAGVYEEVIFRFLVLGLVFILVRLVFESSYSVAAVVALLASSVLFSFYHHMGPFAEAFATPVFLFRLAAGLLLGLVFVFRGFGVAVYLHAFYDVLRDLESVMPHET